MLCTAVAGKKTEELAKKDGGCTPSYKQTQAYVYQRIDVGIHCSDAYIMGEDAIDEMSRQEQRKEMQEKRERKNQGR